MGHTASPLPKPRLGAGEQKTTLGPSLWSGESTSNFLFVSAFKPHLY